tara:strand:+ start:567 stop:1133 length:567 start_codon:yes stop_codon:yes gene_type:complete
MANALEYLLRPIADGLSSASEVAENVATMASNRVRDFYSAPLKFPGKHPFSTLLGGIGAFSGASSAMGISGMVLGGASILAAPIAIPVGAAVGIGLMSLNVMGFTALIYGGIRTVTSAYEMYSDGLRGAGSSTKKAVSNMGRSISNATPNWMKKPFKKNFNASAEKSGPKAQQPQPKPAAKADPKFQF